MSFNRSSIAAATDFRLRYDQGILFEIGLILTVLFGSRLIGFSREVFDECVSIFSQFDDTL